MHLTNCKFLIVTSVQGVACMHVWMQRLMIELEFGNCMESWNKLEN